MKKRILALVLVSIMALSTLAACSKKDTTDEPGTGTKTPPAGGASDGTAETPDGQRELTVWLQRVVNETTNNMIEARVRQFGEENDVTINVELIPYENMMPLWTSGIEAKTLPDVSFMQYQEAGRFYEQGLLTDVSDVIATIEEANGPIIEALKGPTTFGGAQYAIPQRFFSVAIHYRTDMLEAAGFNAPPATWDEFREIAKATTNPSEGIYGAGIGLGATNSDAEWLNQVMLWGLGGAIIAEDSQTIIANSPETVAALDYMSQIYLEDGSTPPSAVNWDDAANNTAFLTGQSAMVGNAGTLLAAIRADDPELYDVTGIAQIPAGPAGFFAPSAGGYLGIFNQSKNQELAKELLAYLFDYDWYKSWIDVEVPSIIPVFERSKDEPEWQDPLTRPFIESMDGVTFIGYPGEFTPKAGEVFNLKLLNETMANIVVNGMTPQEAADILQEKVEAIFNK
ncbi:MAG: sugar ABC transporter substrate-binding protein [Anaerolineaceae bacterium]|nr:MAG: sugar ABC transporter substrate-binding protein [Anaerolineaceae bacterium]